MVADPPYGAELDAEWRDRSVADLGPNIEKSEVNPDWKPLPSSGTGISHGLS
jgi:hypothetical protein